MKKNNTYARHTSRRSACGLCALSGIIYQRAIGTEGNRKRHCNRGVFAPRLIDAAHHCGECVRYHGTLGTFLLWLSLCLWQLTGAFGGAHKKKAHQESTHF